MRFVVFMVVVACASSEDAPPECDAALPDASMDTAGTDVGDRVISSCREAVDDRLVGAACDFLGDCRAANTYCEWASAECIDGVVELGGVRWFGADDPACDVRRPTLFARGPLGEPLEFTSAVAYEGGTIEIEYLTVIFYSGDVEACSTPRMSFSIDRVIGGEPHIFDGEHRVTASLALDADHTIRTSGNVIIEERPGRNYQGTVDFDTTGVCIRGSFDVAECFALRFAEP